MSVREMTKEEKNQYINELIDKNSRLQVENVELKGQYARLSKESRNLKEELDEKKRYIEKLKNGSDERYATEIRYRDGVIDGLKYALSVCVGEIRE